IQRISLIGFPAQSVGSSNTDVLDSPCLLVLITEMSQSRQHGIQLSAQSQLNKYWNADWICTRMAMAPLSLIHREFNSSKPSKSGKNNQDPNMGLVQDQVSNSLEEESFDLELMRIHNLHGPPRFLATINEETKEDLESLRSRNCSRTRILSDLVA
ncbi:hypothetical protein Tco_0934977, partial [Tanacetum coccineum]